MTEKIKRKTLLDILSMMRKYPDLFLKLEASRYLLNEYEKQTIRVQKHGEPYMLSNQMIPPQIRNAFDILCIVDEGLVDLYAGFVSLQEYINIARQSFYFKDNCSFFNVLFGLYESGELTHPQYILTATLFCNWSSKTAELISAKQNIDYYLVDIPTEHNNDNVEYVASQLKRASQNICKVFNKNYDEELVRQAYEKSKEAKLLDKKLNELIDSLPPVLRGIELFNVKVLCYHFLGTDITIEAMKILMDDIDKRIKNNKFLYKNEEYIRSAWTHIRPPHINKLMLQIEKKYNFYLRYTEGMDWDWIAPIDSPDVYIAIASQIFNCPIHGTADVRLKKLEKYIKKYNIKAIFNFQHRNCIAYSGQSKFLSSHFTAQGISVLEINGDAVDVKAMNEGQLLTRIDAFREMLDIKTLPKTTFLSSSLGDPYTI